MVNAAQLLDKLCSVHVQSYVPTVINKRSDPLGAAREIDPTYSFIRSVGRLIVPLIFLLIKPLTIFFYLAGDLCNYFQSFTSEFIRKLVVCICIVSCGAEEQTFGVICSFSKV
jgi:hypothetical protein